MRYELLIQPPRPGEPYDAVALQQLLSARPSSVGRLTDRPDGTRLWRLKHGEVELRPLTEAGKVIATELKVPLSGNLELIREAVLESAALAKEASSVLFDPQLSRQVTEADEGAVADQYLRTARYAGEMVGISEAIGAGQPPLEEGLKPASKVLLGIIAVFVVVYFVFNRLFG